MAEIVRRRSWGGVLPLGRHASISGSSFIQCASASMAPPHPGGAKCYPGAEGQGRTGPNIEMEHCLAYPELLVKRGGRIVAVVGLNVDHIGTAPGGDLAQACDQGRRDALSSMFRADSKVVDVHLAPRLLELVELVGHEPT